MTTTAQENLAARLREARRGRGLSQQTVAEALGVSRPTLIAVEQGRREPKPEEVVNLAALYGRSVAELMRKGNPVPSFAAQFRLGDGSVDEGGARAAVDDLQRIADSALLLELTAGAQSPRVDPPSYELTGLGPEAAAEQLADAERRRLGLGDGPLPQLRAVLENDVGLLVFSLALPSKVAGLYSYAEPTGGCIAINARHPYERQRWSLAHEYAHFLTSRHQAEVTSLAVSTRVSPAERLADAFAGHFLMPALGLVRRFNARRQARGGRFSASDLLQLASLYEVSAEAMALRLQGLKLLTAGWWHDLRDRGFRVEEARQLIGLPQAPADESLLPVRHQYLAVESYLGGLLSEGQLAALLRVDRLTARALVSRLTSTAEIDESGDLVARIYEPEAASLDVRAV